MTRAEEITTLANKFQALALELDQLHAVCRDLRDDARRLDLLTDQAGGAIFVRAKVDTALGRCVLDLLDCQRDSLAGALVQEIGT